MKKVVQRIYYKGSKGKKSLIKATKMDFWPFSIRTTLLQGTIEDM